MVDHRNELVFGHLNTNSARNKFELLSEQVKIDVLIISETKAWDLNQPNIYAEPAVLKCQWIRILESQKVLLF